MNTKTGFGLVNIELEWQGIEPSEKLDKRGYPINWKALATIVKEENRWKCERCGHHHEPSTGHVLTVHHLDNVKKNCARWNLAALCQKCHLRIQARVVMPQLFMQEILEISDWFRPHLEGYLASLKQKKSVDRSAV